MNDPKYAYPYPAQGYYQGPPVMAPPQYAAPPPRRQLCSIVCFKEEGDASPSVDGPRLMCTEFTENHNLCADSTCLSILPQSEAINHSLAALCCCCLIDECCCDPSIIFIS